MTDTFLFSPSTLARMAHVESARAKYFQRLVDPRDDVAPVWLRLVERLGLGGNMFYSRRSDQARYRFAAAALGEFHRCMTKWATAAAPSDDEELALLVRLFTKQGIFADGAFEVTKDSLPLYNAAMLDVVKFFVLEAPVMGGLLRKSNVGTRIERNDIVNVLKEHWLGFRMPRKTAPRPRAA